MDFAAMSLHPHHSAELSGWSLSGAIEELIPGLLVSQKISIKPA